MTLGELLEKLKDLPKESTVVIDDGMKYFSIADIRITDPEKNSTSNPAIIISF